MAVLFFLIRSIGRVPPPRPPLLPLPPQPKPSPGGRLAGALILAFLLPLMIAGFREGMNGDIQLTTVAAYVIAFLALILLFGVFRLGGIARSRYRDRQALKDMPIAPTLADERAKTARMRDYAVAQALTVPIPVVPTAQEKTAAMREAARLRGWGTP